MAVAKSYQNYRVLGEPYIKPNEKNKNKYIKVQKDADSPIKEVRWYTDAEYRKKYGAEPPSIPIDVDKITSSDDCGNSFYYSFTLGECSDEEREAALGWLWTQTFCPTSTRSWWLPNYVDIDTLSIPKGIIVAEKQVVESES